VDSRLHRHPRLVRSKAWYPRASSALAALATLAPALALIGFTNAGLNLRERVRQDRPRPRTI